MKDNILRPGFGMGGHGPPSPSGLTLDIRFGESPAALQCINCPKMMQAGLYVIVKGQPILLCVHCVAGALVKYQEIHPLDHLIEVDSNIPPEVMSRALDETQKEFPDIPPARIEKIVRSALDRMEVK